MFNKNIRICKKNKLNLNPKKKLGQNFLIDENVIKKIVECAPVSNKNEILEIGPGTGNLTKFLIDKDPKKIFLIEKDKKLYEILKDKFGKKVEIFNEDILKFKNKNILSDNTVIFGNLPYNISSQILTKFIFNFENFKFKMLIFMFQKELADRIIANVNSSNYGRLSIISNWKFNINKVFDISSNSFFPKPKIKSSLLIFTHKKNIYKFRNPKILEEITKVFFNQRRKKIKKQFNFLFNNNQEIVRKLNIDLNLRPQNLSPETYYKLTTELEKLRN